MKAQAVNLKINESVEYEAAVVQYFDIDFSSLNLNLVHQHHYRNLPHSLEYWHDKGTAPALILAKLYSGTQTETYLISLHISVRSIDGVTYISEENRCVHVRILFQANKGK
jgi:hypothetical protein